ncbi:MAG: cell division protein FtsZ [Bacteroidota bacterium]
MSDKQTTSTMLKFESPKNQASIIKVIGVGGGGGNAVNYMYSQGIKGVDFIICNTDAQALDKSPVPNKIQLGTKGLGAGNIPLVAREAAKENAEAIKEMLSGNTKMLFITAGMGGGTGTGAAPVIAEIARELDILTVGIITLPFDFEGRKRSQQAEQGIKEMLLYVDSIIIINNEKLRELFGNLKISEAFKKADDVLLIAAKGIAEIITVEGQINVDFEDINTVMKNSGGAIMSSAEAEGENRAHEAVETALRSPLLNDASIKGAKNILLYLTSGAEEITMNEITEITDHIKFESGSNSDVIWGNGYDEKLGNKISVTIIATGFETNHTRSTLSVEPVERRVTPLNPEIIKDTVAEAIEFAPQVQPTHTYEPEPEIIIAQKEEKAEEDLNDFKLHTGTANTVQNQINVQAERPKEIIFVRQQDETVETKPSQQAAFSSTNDPAFEEEDKDVNQKAKERKDRLRLFSAGLKTEEGLGKIESIPAYKRYGIELTEVTPSNESEVSKYQLDMDENNQVNLTSNNTFLHGAVD